MRIGIHVSTRGSIASSIDNTLSMGCNAFQIFVRDPRGWSAPPLSKKEISDFRKKFQASKIDRFSVFSHMPYLPNFSSPDKVSFPKSMRSLIDEVKRCSQLGIPYLVAHLGSHNGIGAQKGVETVIKAFTKAAKMTPDDVVILLENSTGHKHSVGSAFEELALIFSRLRPRHRFGICFDSCHAFAAGYDMRTPSSASATLKKFTNYVGAENVKAVHLNDSKGEIGCKKDIHEHIGLGCIGKKGLARVVKFAKSSDIPVILETPIDDRSDDLENIKKVRAMAK